MAAQSATQAEASRLLSLVKLPPQATELQGASPEALDGPAMGTPASTSLVLATKYWSVPLSLQATWDWFGANPPDGLQPSGTMHASAQAGQQQVVWGYGYGAPASLAWTGAGVNIGMTAISANVTAVRVDGLALWLDQTPLRDDQVGLRMNVRVATGCPESSQNYVGVTNPPPALTDTLLPSQSPTNGLVCRYQGVGDQAFTIESQAVLNAASAAALAEEFQQLPLSHTNGNVINCPNDDGAVTVVVFAFSDRADFSLWVRTKGCGTVANGSILTANQGTVVP